MKTTHFKIYSANGCSVLSDCIPFMISATIKYPGQPKISFLPGILLIQNF